jgi:hypothetical protein
MFGSEMFTLARAFWEPPSLQTKGRNSRPEMKRPSLEEKYYREAARALFWVLNLMRVAQKDIEPKVPFERAMNQLEADFLFGLRHRYRRLFQTGVSPATLKEFERLMRPKLK